MAQIIKQHCAREGLSSVRKTATSCGNCSLGTTKQRLWSGHTSADMKVFDWIVGELISHRHPSGWRQNVLHILVIVVSAQLNKVKLHQRVVDTCEVCNKYQTASQALRSTQKGDTKLTIISKDDS